MFTQTSFTDVVTVGFWCFLEITDRVFSKVPFLGGSERSAEPDLSRRHDTHILRDAHEHSNIFYVHFPLPHLHSLSRMCLHLVLFLTFSQTLNLEQPGLTHTVNLEQPVRIENADRLFSNVPYLGGSGRRAEPPLPRRHELHILRDAHEPSNIFHLHSLLPHLHSLSRICRRTFVETLELEQSLNRFLYRIFSCALSVSVTYLILMVQEDETNLLFLGDANRTTSKTPMNLKRLSRLEVHEYVVTEFKQPRTTVLQVDSPFLDLPPTASNVNIY